MTITIIFGVLIIELHLFLKYLMIYYSLFYKFHYDYLKVNWFDYVTLTLI